MSPASGSTAGGDTVILTGRFAPILGVTFGGHPAASFTPVSRTELSVVTPAHPAGPVTLAVYFYHGVATQTTTFTFVAPAPPPIPAPTLSGIAPPDGPVAGGTTVALTGTNLTGTTAVTFGATPASSFTVDSDTQITATAPAGSGTVDVGVTAPGGSAALPSAYTYVPAPVPAGITPATGPAAGGTSVVITGSHLTGASAVTFGGIPAISFTVDSDSQITAVAPAGSGVVDIAVTTSGGTGSLTGAFTYVPAPTLSNVAPAAGPATGGTSVTITGLHLTGASAVTFGGVAAASYTVDSDTQITAVTAPGTGTVDVAVTTIGGTATLTGAYTFVPPPVLASIAPAAGPTAGGTSVTITGSHLTGASAVTFGGVAAASYTIDSDTQITAVTAPGTGTVDVAVTTTGGTGTLTGAYTFVPPPVLTSIAPTAGPLVGGTTVTITGEHLTGASAVTFGGVDAASYTVDSDTQITAVTPAGTGTVDVAVTTIGGTGTLAGAYTFVPPPVIASLDLTFGMPGATITITGTAFTLANEVDFGTTPATTFTVVSDTEISAVVPSGAGSVPLTVVSPGGTSNSVPFAIATPGNDVKMRGEGTIGSPAPAGHGNGADHATHGDHADHGSDAARVTFSVNVQCNAKRGELEYQAGHDHSRVSFHLATLDAVLCTTDTTIPTGRQADWNTMTLVGHSRDGQRIVATFVDRGEPGRNDSATITVSDASGTVLSTVSGTLDGGNLQAVGNLVPKAKHDDNESDGAGHNASTGAGSRGRGKQD